MTTPQSIVVVGRRWFQKHGNTYHSAEIIVDGERVGQTPITYGYGEQYLWTAFNWLEKKGIIEEYHVRHRPATYCESIGCKLVYTVADVGSKAYL